MAPCSKRRATASLVTELGAGCQQLEGFASDLLKSGGELARRLAKSLGLDGYQDALQGAILGALGEGEKTLEEIKHAAAEAAARLTRAAENQARQLLGSLQETVRDALGTDPVALADQAVRLHQQGSATLSLLRALGDPPKTDRLGLNRPEVAYVMAQANKIVDMTPAIALVNRVSDTVAAGNYPALRYCDRAALFAQRWGWRGRPQDDGFGEDKRGGGQGGKTGGLDLTTLATLAFLDRADDDVGDIVERRLERKHVYAGRERLADHAPAFDRRPVLIDKNLDWRGGLNLWRFGLRLTSRYAALRPGSEKLVKFSHRDRTGVSWHVEPVKDRANGRIPKRPGLALVLPLTEPVMADGAIPPLLALFNEALHVNDHLGDGLEVAIESVRHPFTRDDMQRHHATDEREADLLADALAGLSAPERTTIKHWQEFGPDPIRTGRAASGNPLALRLDGPIGYTHDPGATVARFDHAGFLLTPIATPVEPWSLVKLRFRRFEAPEGIDGHVHRVPAGQAPLTARVRVVGRSGAAPPFSESAGAPRGSERDPVTFAIDHEGVVWDVADWKVGSDFRLTIGFEHRVHAPPQQPHRVELVCSRLARGIKLTFSTHLGPAGGWEIETRDATPRLRIVVSARDIPKKGRWRPVGDVSVRLRLERDDDAADVLSRPAENRWLTITTLPLTCRDEFPVSAPLFTDVHVENRSASPLPGFVVRPIRLSSFTPALWCQFADATSEFQGRRKDNSVVPVKTSALTATLGGAKEESPALSIAFRGPTAPALQKLSLARPPDLESTLEEALFVVVTRYVTDAFDRLRERPVAICAYDGSVVVPLAPEGGLAWPAGSKLTKTTCGSKGRLRFLRMLRLKRADGTLATPENLFKSEMIAPEMNLNPSDAKGLLLGISMPIEWKS